MLVMSDKRLVMEPSGEGREMILDIPGLPPYKGQPCCNAPGAQGGSLVRTELVNSPAGAI